MVSSSYEDTFSFTDSEDDFGGEDDHSLVAEDDSIVDEFYTSHGGKVSNDLKQHFIAIGIAIVSALVTHMRINGGYISWRDEMRKDWNILMERFGNSDVKYAPAPYAAPSINNIPTRQFKVAYETGKNYSKDQHQARSGGGHERARGYRRTAGLSFCPAAHLIASSASVAAEEETITSSNNLEEVEFLLALDPSVRVLHSYYLADLLQVESAMVYEDPAAEFLGTYGDDVILKDIDLLTSDVTIEDVKNVLESHLPATLVDNEHACLLHQYALNKATRRSIRGTTKVYVRPHVSTFYRNKFPSHPVAAFGKPTPKVGPAPLTFTGFATKFVNLSTQPVKLYWDGGRIPSGPREGQMHTILVGTVESMESIGTASHPGHQFFVSTTYDKDHVLSRHTATMDEPVWYYDPFENLAIERRAEEMKKMTRDGKWTAKQRFGREAWMVNQSFSRDYLVKTRMVWFANFPQPYNDGSITASEKVSNHMWQADYVDQVHTFDTTNLYFAALPEKLERLTMNDYEPDIERQRLIAMEKFQSPSLKGELYADSSNSMSLNLKVISCAPRVVEVRKFLSPIEVQHLINLAFGATGNIVMEPSKVSSQSKRMRGDAMAEVRSSRGGWIHREQDVVVDTIFRRVADLLNINESLMRDHYPSDGLADDIELPRTHDRVVEAMQLLRYEPGEGYTAHHDFTFPSVLSRYQPKRFASVLLYLTGEGDIVQNGVRSRSSRDDDGKALFGGETTFPRAVTTDSHDGIKIKPQSGNAVLFYNVLPDGNMDDLSQHASEKVEDGVKYLANIFVWDPIIG